MKDIKVISSIMSKRISDKYLDIERVRALIIDNRETLKQISHIMKPLEV